MKAYEFPVKVTTDGKLDVPASFAELLIPGQIVRVIVLINEAADVLERADWSRLTTEQFLSGYSEADAIYDKMN